MSEIVYVCKSINNKNVRGNELKILRKVEKKELCFEFGMDENNLKKRFYDNKDFFENDFEELLKIKENIDNPKVLEDVQEPIEESIEEPVKVKVEKELKINKHKRGRIKLS